MYILLAGLNHKTAPIEIRETLALNGVKLDNAYEYLTNYNELEGVVILTTCNRTEIYATTRDIEKGVAVLQDFLRNYSGLSVDDIEKHTYQPTCYDAISHIFRVSSGLDSMVLGETQILGQVKEAHFKAMELDASDGVLNTLFQKAVHVGKKVRNETEIDKHPVSVSYTAVELAKNILGTLTDKTVLVVGAGEMSELTTQYLLSNGVSSVIVSNRSYEKAVEMASKFNGKAIYFDALEKELPNADIVISCTSANHYVIKGGSCSKALVARKGKKILMIDIAVPRDIDPSLQEIDGVYIYDIDDLQNVIDKNYFQRQKAGQLAETIIYDELEKFNEWLSMLYVIPVISALKKQGETIKQEELKRAFNRLGKVSDREQKVIVSMANAIVNQLLRNPVIKLKEMALSNSGHLYAEVLKTLFELQVDEEHGQDVQIKGRNKG
ncbi:Glutamyl-tRNA reductase [Candidatus Syntrophocurvum alkaliphilum]|uniref:Glutamyl-tRNA reductase n=1 Tax=Candidatus Syntrophocurvum alkaliphilum TaxID=2293317 RepID=A0A6I6DD90_9FIRM|nr:glutamyl-tRNA reductase [Candidatus Syntrophocurvum alkaliphilum]QGT99050.1 Glutamyl-tRNA reductase [Candidatus Syntrophocurvum alkaliphilum]